MKSPLKDRPLRNPGQSNKKGSVPLCSEARQSDVWILNPKALPAFIPNSGEQLTDEDVGLVGYHLSRFVRAGD